MPAKKYINGLDVFHSNHNFGIYAYINKNDKKVIYIGKDSQINKSKRHHKHISLECKELQSINKWLQDNPEAWEYQIWSLCSNEDVMEDIEASLIEQFKMIGQCTFNTKSEIDYKKYV